MQAVDPIRTATRLERMLVLRRADLQWQANYVAHDEAKTYGRTGAWIRITAHCAFSGMSWTVWITLLRAIRETSFSLAGQIIADVETMYGLASRL